MEECMVCERIDWIKNGKNPYFVKELNTGYVVIGDHQRIKGYSLFLCKEHATELHFLEPHFRDEFLHEMAIVAEAVYNAFQPDKLNYELLGAGNGVHMHWHLFPRRKGDTDTDGPVWKLGAELAADEFLPTPEELEDLKTRLCVELEKLLMENQLKLVAESYDRGIELGKQGMDSYDNFPAYITNHPYYPLFQKMRENVTSDSAGKEIAEYLDSKTGMKFIDLGCCLNFMFSGYKDWPSDYYGVDISSKTIDLLKEYAKKNHLAVGDFCCCSMHETPYEKDFFDIGACVGSLEYFEKEFVQQAVAEFSRIMKPNGRFVLDIPNLGSPEFEIAKLIEEYLGRQDRFNSSVEEFENILEPYFAIEKKEIVGPMIQYFLVCSK